MLTTYFVVSVLGRNEFWMADGNMTTAMVDGQIFSTFSAAEIALTNAIANYGPNYGTYGWEIRTIIA